MAMAMSLSPRRLGVVGRARADVAEVGFGVGDRRLRGERAEIAPTAGAMIHLTTVDGARTTGTLAYDPDGNVVVKIATETLELGAVLDAYDSISEVDRRLPILRPPRRVAPATPPPRKGGSGTFARVIDDAAAKLFAPAVLGADSAAAARRRERIVGPLVPPGIEGADTMFTTARAAARASTTTYAGSRKRTAPRHWQRPCRRTRGDPRLRPSRR